MAPLGLRQHGPLLFPVSVEQTDAIALENQGIDEKRRCGNPGSVPFGKVSQDRGSRRIVDDDSLCLGDRDVENVGGLSDPELEVPDQLVGLLAKPETTRHLRLRYIPQAEDHAGEVTSPSTFSLPQCSDKIKGRACGPAFSIQDYLQKVLNPNIYYWPVDLPKFAAKAETIIPAGAPAAIHAAKSLPSTSPSSGAISP